MHRKFLTRVWSSVTCLTIWWLSIEWLIDWLNGFNILQKQNNINTLWVLHYTTIFLYNLPMRYKSYEHKVKQCVWIYLKIFVCTQIYDDRIQKTTDTENGICSFVPINHALHSLLREALQMIAFCLQIIS